MLPIVLTTETENRPLEVICELDQSRAGVEKLSWSEAADEVSEREDDEQRQLVPGVFLHRGTMESDGGWEDKGVFFLSVGGCCCVCKPSGDTPACEWECRERKSTMAGKRGAAASAVAE